MTFLKCFGTNTIFNFLSSFFSSNWYGTVIFTSLWMKLRLSDKRTSPKLFSTWGHAKFIIYSQIPKSVSLLQICKWYSALLPMTECWVAWKNYCPLFAIAVDNWKFKIIKVTEAQCGERLKLQSIGLFVRGLGSSLDRWDQFTTALWNTK